MDRASKLARPRKGDIEYESAVCEAVREEITFIVGLGFPFHVAASKCFIGLERFQYWQHLATGTEPGSAGAVVRDPVEPFRSLFEGMKCALADSLVGAVTDFRRMAEPQPVYDNVGRPRIDPASGLQEMAQPDPRQRMHVLEKTIARIERYGREHLRIEPSIGPRVSVEAEADSASEGKPARASVHIYLPAEEEEDDDDA